MLFGSTDPGAFYQDTTMQVAIITTIGLIIVALIGVFTARITTGARKEIRTKSDEASKSADVAKDYAFALEAKNALIDSLEARVKFLEEQTNRQTLKLEELTRREEEHAEQQRAASAIERTYSRELNDLRTLVDELKHRDQK